MRVTNADTMLIPCMPFLNRSPRSAATCGIIVMIVSLITKIIAAASPSAESIWQTEERNKQTVIKDLHLALKSAKKAGRLYYFTGCKDDGGPRLAFPWISVYPFPKNKKGLDAVRHLFKGNKAVTVTKFEDNIIRVNIGKAPNAILQTKIALLTLNEGERYTPDLAVTAIQNTKEVKGAEARLALQEPVRVSSIAIQHPVRGVPHLPASMKNVTMDQALDAVAKTFGVIIVFAECAFRTGNHLYSVDVEAID
jgi:hypothetical protein